MKIRSIFEIREGGNDNATPSIEKDVAINLSQMSADTSSIVGIRAISLWLNERLKRHGLYCYDFSTDLSDGILLHKLLQAEETSSPQLSSSGPPLASFGTLLNTKKGGTHNLQIIVKYLQSRGVKCGELGTVLPYIAMSDDSSESEEKEEDENSNEANEDDDKETNSSANSGSESSKEDAAVNVDSSAHIMLFVWKIFEYIRGKQALFGEPLPETTTDFAKMMLTWAEKQVDINHEKDNGFPLRKPHDLTDR
jgi:hypothetical protein